MTVKQEYQKERRRITQLMRRAEGRGYILPENTLPPIPKRVTRASVRRLKAITPASMYLKSAWVDPTTGEYLSGVEGRKIERQRAAQKAVETRKREKELSAPRGKSTRQPDKEKVNIPYYPAEVDISFGSLIDIIESSLNTANARILKYYIDHYKFRYGAEKLIEAFKTPEGREAIARAAEIAQDSDGERAIAWASALERLMVKMGVITFETYKQVQEDRYEERERDREGKQDRSAEELAERDKRILEKYNQITSKHRQG